MNSPFYNVGQIKSYSGCLLDRKEFSQFRERLNKTQVGLSKLLGVSVNAVHAYEQGWRNVPVHVERQIFLLAFLKQGTDKRKKPCWAMKDCPPGDRKKCPAWEFRAGQWCWYINGTICEGTVRRDWNEKMGICRNCEVFQPILNPEQEQPH